MLCAPRVRSGAGLTKHRSDATMVRLIHFRGGGISRATQRPSVDGAYTRNEVVPANWLVGVVIAL